MKNLPILFNDVVNDITNESLRFSDLLDRMFDKSVGLSNGTFAPRMDVSENKKQFDITVALPGMKKEDIDINVENNVLTVSGERRREQTQDNENYHRVETTYGRFSRSLPFPNIINPDKVKAKYEDGLLHITIPKVKEKAGKKIKVS